MLQYPKMSMSDRRPPNGWSWAQRKAALVMYVLLRSVLIILSNDFQCIFCHAVNLTEGPTFVGAGILRIWS